MSVGVVGEKKGFSWDCAFHGSWLKAAAYRMLRGEGTLEQVHDYSTTTPSYTLMYSMILFTLILIGAGAFYATYNWRKGILRETITDMQAAVIIILYCQAPNIIKSCLSLYR
jgi:hypothetical protein